MIGNAVMPANFKYRSVFLKGRPVHQKYDDFWRKHPPMDRLRWAKIFSPFDALEGFDDAIDRRRVLYCSRRELSDGQEEELNKKLSLLHSLTVNARAARDNHIAVDVEYFKPCTDIENDSFGCEGQYETVSGIVLKVDAVISRTIHLLTADGEKMIPLDDVNDITGTLLESEIYDIPSLIPLPISQPILT